MKLSLLKYFRHTSVKQFSVFFAIALFFLFFSKLSNTYKQYLKLNIELHNVAEEISILNDSSNYVNVLVEANGFALVTFLFQKEISVKVDAKKDILKTGNKFVFNAKAHKYLIEEQLGSYYKILSLEPDTISIAFDKMTSKTVPLVIKSNINFDIGYDVLKTLAPDVDSIKIVGSKQALDSITYLETKLIELDKVNTDIDQVVDVNLSLFKTVKAYPKTVTVRGEVVKHTEGTLQVPVSIINKPEGVRINYFPKTVTLSYYVDLEHYNSISSSDFIVECQYANSNNPETYLTPKITKYPNVVKRVSLKTKRIDYIQL